MRLDDVLNLEPVKTTTPRVLAGHNRLHAPVTWVHISEMERVANLFHGGELLLTQGRGIPRTSDGQHAWIGSLAEAEVAGVAIETGHVFAKVPTVLIEAADQLDLPLIELPRPAFFMEITRAVHSAIVRSDHDGLAHSTELTRRLYHLVSNGGSLQEALDEITSAVGHPISLTGSTHALRARAPQQHPALQRIEDWRQHTLEGHDLHTLAATASPQSQGLICWHTSIHVHGEFWACLHMLTDLPDRHIAQTLSLEMAGSILALAYAPREGLASAATDMWSEILHEVLAIPNADNGDRLRWGGLDPDKPLRVIVMEPLDPGAAGAGTVGGQRRTEALLSLSHKVQTLLPVGAIVGHFANRIVVIASETLDLSPLAKATWSRGKPAIAGVSGLVQSAGLARAAKDAAEALTYALETGLAIGLHFAEHLYLERLLLRLVDDGTLQDVVEHELGPIFDLPPAARTALLSTLEAYFACNGNKTEIAQNLGVDRRTVRQRVERINDLVGKRFGHPDKQLSLRLAARGLRLLGDRQVNRDEVTKMRSS